MKKLGFEKSMARLEEIVKLLEQGQAPLDESLSLFEEGTGLVRHCGALLDGAEAKVKMLMRDGELAPFASQEEG